MLIIQRPTVEPLGEERDNRQQFAIGPLEPGFGYTLGNSLRRTLLSSIPGAAPTQVRFDDSLHEFATLPGIKEDVNDIILSLKDLVLRVHVDDPVTLRLDARSPADVTAGDIQLTPDVEILNADLHIATLNARSRLAVDITVERGRGYVSAERNKRSSAIGVIPLDSTFRSAPATVSSGPRSTPSASWSRSPKRTCWPSPTSGRSRSTRCSRSSTSGAWPCAVGRARPPCGPRRRRGAASAAAHRTRRP